MAGAQPRFGIYALADAPFPVLRERWRLAEELGFELMYVADHTGDWRDLSGHWFECWTVLAAMAVGTQRIRIGSLIANPILRSPVLLAKEAVAVDHLSGGRLELGIGTGITAFDHLAAGVEPWPMRERMARFAEYVEVVDGLLRDRQRDFRFSGTYLRTAETPASPGPIQQPRPPITVAGQSPTLLRVAAERADCWNTLGQPGHGVARSLEVTRRQNDQLDDLCLARGRRPGDLRRSLLLFEELDAWSSPGALEEVVPRFHRAGIDEFVLFWPPGDRRDLLERAASETIPALRRL